MNTVESIQTENLTSSAASMEERFKLLANEIKWILQTEGIAVRAYTSDMRHFRALSWEQKDKVLILIQFYRDLCIEQTKEGYLIKDSKSFLWRALQKLGLIPPSDLFDRVMDEDVVEIYSLENVQLFRNFKFFELCSYSLEELYSVAWWYLFERDEEQGPKLIAEVTKLLTGEIHGGFRPNVLPHMIKESQSEERLKIDYDVKWVAPLMSHKNIGGFIAIESGRLRV